jgi:Phenylalanyl-tRNA synthetase beta subunit
VSVSYYKPFSNYPPVKRDTAILVSSEFESQKIFELIKTHGSELIEDVYIFDVYKGKGIPEGKQSIAFRVTYRAFEKTLTSEEVDSIHSKLVEQIISETGAELRF